MSLKITNTKNLVRCYIIGWQKKFIPRQEGMVVMVNFGGMR